MRKTNGKARSRFIGSSLYETGLSKKTFQLGLPLLIVIEAREKDNRDIVPRIEPRLAHAPAFTYDSPSPVSRDGIGIGSNGNENGPNGRAIVRQYMDTHALTRKPGSARKDFIDLSSLPDPIRLGIPLPGDIETSTPSGRISKASSRRRRIA
jgi:hypothetical protein